MDTNTCNPTTLVEAIRHFANPDVAFEVAKNLRWPHGVACPRCGTTDVRFVKTRRIWECKHCTTKKQFTVKVGTIMEDSPLSLDKWLITIWLIANAKNGISSYEVGRALGITQKSAWFMLQRVRLAMQSGTLDKLSGHIEADETFIGGKARNMHYGKRKAKGRGAVGKAIVMGILERKGEARTMVVPNTKRSTLQPKVKQHVEAGSAVYTDSLPSYEGLKADYVHQAVDHAEKYVDGVVHTNGLENFWSLLKRCINGTYVSVEPFHLFRYLDEQTFRFNNRKTNDGERFRSVASNLSGKRLTYKALIGEDATEPDAASQDRVEA